MIVITNNSIFDLRMRPDPKEVAESIGFPPSMSFAAPTPFRAQVATTMESEVKFSFSERTREMFGKGIDEGDKGNRIREMQRRKEIAAPKAIQKRGKGKGALE